MMMESKTGNYYTEKRILAVDSNFLQLFNYQILKGDAASCLRNPNSVVLTEQTAQKYFGSTDAIGKMLQFGTDKKVFLVSAVLKNIPQQSSFQFDMLAPINAYSGSKKTQLELVLAADKYLCKNKEYVKAGRYQRGLNRNFWSWQRNMHFRIRKTWRYLPKKEANWNIV